MSSHKTIMIIDDDTAILDALSIALAEQGYAVTTSIDGNSLSTLTPPYPDLLLLDIWLGNIDGRELSKKLKSNPDTQSIPIIIFSANKNIEQLTAEAQADAGIAKPFSITTLNQQINQLINR